MTKSVVVIDDDMDDIEIMKDAIAEVDPSIVVWGFNNSLEALKVVTRELIVIPSYFFIDINMPLKSGFECLTELRSHTQFASTPIIMYSTSMPSTIKDNLKRSGADFAFQKPTDYLRYNDILREIFESR
jgi:CheY-like chemotaxis protein